MPNPYQTPAAELTMPASSSRRQLGEPARLNASRGIDWLSEGWRLFMRAPGMLLGISVLMVILYALMALVPLLGNLALLLLWPMFTAGLFLALRHADEGQPVTFADLFAPFAVWRSLMGLGWLSLLAGVVVSMIAAAALFAFGVLTTITSQGFDPAAGWGQAGMGMMLVPLLVVALMAALSMGFIFSPILVYQHQVPAMEAIRLSFVACLRNVLPFLLWGLAFLAGSFVAGLLGALIPLLGGLVMLAFCLLLVPLSAASLYCAYRDIFWH